MTKMTDKQRKYFEDNLNIVNEMIIKQLEEFKTGECLSWVRFEAGAPVNPITGTRYSGYNFFSLMIQGEQRGFSSNNYATYKQITSVGGKVNKGAKACTIIFSGMIWRMNGKTVLKEKVTEAFKSSGLSWKNFKEDFKVYNFRTEKLYKVFNLCETTLEDKYKKVVELNEHKEKECQVFLDEKVKHLTDEKGLNFREIQSNRAYYHPGADYINMPLRGQFSSLEDFVSVSFHEIAHWTKGGEDRLKRDLSYGQEELVAELTTLYICSSIGIQTEVLESSLAYLDSWLKSIKEKPSYLYETANYAQKAMNFILAD